MKSVIPLQMVFLVAAAAGVYSFVTSAREGERRRLCAPACSLRPRYGGANRTAPDFELPNLDGTMRRLSDYRGQVVVMNFWSKTCRPCLEEMPSIADLSKLLAQQDKGLTLITVTTDESAEDARSTLRSVLGGDAPFETLVDANNSVVADRYGTALYPETWFIDPKGVIRARFDGARDWSEPLNVEYALSLKGPVTCDIGFRRGQAAGRDAAVCNDVPPAF